MIGIGNVIQLAGNGGGGGGSSDFASITGLPTSNAALNPYLSSITNLENNEFKYLYWEAVSSSSGTITIPTGATVLLGEIQGLDALVETIQSGRPTGNSPVTSGGSPVIVSSFDAAGNYTLSGTPSAYPVAVLFVLLVKGKDISNLTLSQVIADEQIGVMIGASGSSDGKLGSVPKPVLGEQNKVLTGSSIWKTIQEVMGYIPVSIHTADHTTFTAPLDTSENIFFVSKPIAPMPIGSFMQILTQWYNAASSGSKTVRVYLSPNPTLSGAVLCGFVTYSGISVTFFSRTIRIKSSTQVLPATIPTISSANDTNNNPINRVNINTTTVLYLILTVQKTNPSDGFGVVYDQLNISTTMP